MADETLLSENRAGVFFLTLNRPADGNRIDQTLRIELCQLLDDLRDDESVRAVVIAGSGDHFCRGDAWAERLGEERPASELRAEWRRWDAPGRIEALGKPVVAALQGETLGAGLELALACDLRLAAEGARFGFPEVGLGLLPSGGGTQRLPRVVGRGSALELILTARPIDAQEAYRIGLVQRVLPPTGLLASAEALARPFVEKSPLSVAIAKEALLKGADLTLDQAMRLEADLGLILQTTHDRREGIRAFLEKRKPQFRGE